MHTVISYGEPSNNQETCSQTVRVKEQYNSVKTIKVLVNI